MILATIDWTIILAFPNADPHFVKNDFCIVAQ